MKQPPRKIVSTTVDLEPATAPIVAGTADENLRVIEDLVDADLFSRGHHVTVRGEASQVSRARQVLRELESMAARGSAVTPDLTRRTVDLVDQTNAQVSAPTEDSGAEMSGMAEVTQPAIVTRRGKTVRPKTLGQRDYVDAIDNSTVVVGVGPAGTGKTYLAVAKAVQALQNREITRIILTRPAVEAGEKLGFLPGTLGEKIDPYLRPLYDALRDMLDPEAIPKLIESGVIEVAPLAYMRGRTLNGAFVILDEAQNTTPAQMKMFLTRLGFGSKIVVTGDLTQVDLPNHQKSGLTVAHEILSGVDGVTVTEFDSQDVVRHHLVGRIIQAYDRYEAAQAADEELARQDREERQAERRWQQAGRSAEGRVR
ncbi:MAG TPA: PhoH family protein [Candidatus Corynebacterium faecigallinarum]|uniref:PhoH-like protein n=2 Tax=Corynebacterium TaxID=1716 RepID=A0A9D2QHF5_9CORY|nr:PhoH family protein [Candidatus Corynebacterium faecigallinarum]